MLMKTMQKTNAFMTNETWQNRETSKVVAQQTSDYAAGNDVYRLHHRAAWTGAGSENFSSSEEGESIETYFRSLEEVYTYEK